MDIEQLIYFPIENGNVYESKYTGEKIVIVGKTEREILGNFYCSAHIDFDIDNHIFRNISTLDQISIENEDILITMVNEYAISEYYEFIGRVSDEQIKFIKNHIHDLVNTGMV